MDEALQFLQPVNTKKVIDYLDKIKNPMDLATIKEKIQEKRYSSRGEFLSDISQIWENSKIYNGDDDLLTKAAKRLFDVVADKFSENEAHLMKLEKLINPLLSDSTQEQFSYILKSIIEDNIKPLQEVSITYGTIGICFKLYFLYLTREMLATLAFLSL